MPLLHHNALQACLAYASFLLVAAAFCVKCRMQNLAVRKHHLCSCDWGLPLIRLCKVLLRWNAHLAHNMKTLDMVILERAHMRSMFLDMNQLAGLPG